MKKFSNFRLCAIALCLLAILTPLASFNAQVVKPRRPAAPITVTFAVATGAQTNQTYVTVTPKDANGNAIPGLIADFYWSDSASGAGVTATASSGTSGPITSIGTLLQVTAATPTVATSRVSQRLMTDAATGKFTVGVIDSAKTLFYPCVNIAGFGVACGSKLATANYL